MNPICTVMVGIPASGKSTRVAQMCEMDPDAYVYSTDAILERTATQLGKTYNDVFEQHIGNAKLEADIALGEAMKHGLNIIWDQTNLGVKKRRSIIERMKKAGYIVECECFVLPEDVEDINVLTQRIRNRPGKNIPIEVIENMVNSYVIPTVPEGFVSVVYWDIHGKLTGSEDIFDYAIDETSTD